jgi:hypothetical protein
MGVEEQVMAFEPEDLARIVRHISQRSALEVARWQIEPLADQPSIPTTLGLYRIAGSGSDGATPVSWSLILKVLQAPPAAASIGDARLTGWRDPRHVFFWMREPLVYQSAVFGDLPPGLAAPRGVVTAPANDQVWLWLEELHDRYGGHWPFARTELAARHLGQFGGAYVSQRPLPSDPLFHPVGMRQAIDSRAAPMAALIDTPSAWDHPLIRDAFPSPVAERFRRLWANRDALWAALDRQPRTLSHLDPHRGNLFARQPHPGTGTAGAAGAADETVAIDWGSLSVAPVGLDLIRFAESALLGMPGDRATLAHQRQTLLDAYVAGLRGAGWHGNPTDIWLTYAAGVALYASLATAARAIRTAAAGRSCGALATATYVLLDIADRASAHVTR